MKLRLIARKPEPPTTGAARDLLLRNTVRAELAARGVVTRRWLVARVVTVLQLHDVTEEEAANTIDELEAADDLISGSHGRVAPSPLRIVKVHDRYLLVGTLPSVEWRLACGPMLDESRVSRSFSSADERLERLAALVAQFGGLQIPLARWAGLDRVKAADHTWIDELDARLTIAAQTISDDDNAHWQGFAASTSGEFRKRWRLNTADGGTRLWRRFLGAGYSEHAWTNGSSPATTPWIRISADEALRTAYSLTRTQPVELFVSSSGDDHELRVAERLPYAEYRWLVGAANAVINRTFSLTTAQCAQAQAMLRERLGVEAASSPSDHSSPGDEQKKLNTGH